MSLVGWVSVACDAQPTMSFGGLRRLRRLTHPTAASPNEVGGVGGWSVAAELCHRWVSPTRRNWDDAS
jgi:hypothetical protein